MSVASLLTFMLGELTTTCDADGCDREIGAAEFRLEIETAAGRRRAYECDCGAVTITVARE